MKLETRSPKDVCWDYRDENTFAEAVQNLKNYLYKQNVTNETPLIKLNNLLYRFFLENCQDKLLVRNGDDFVHIFSRS